MSKSFGKLILAGEHAVVYGKPALIVPIDRFCEVKISVGEGLTTLPMGQVVRPVPTKIINNANDPHGLVEYVVKKFLQEFQIKNLPNLRIEINSNIPVGRGFGSSAAVITAVVKGLTEFLGVGVNPSILLDFCISCENLIHKTSSGADIYAAWFGKPLWFRRESANLKLWRELEIDKRESGESGKSEGWGELGIYLVDTGKPVEATGEMVQIAAKLKNSRPKFFERQINSIERRTLSLLHSFTTLQNPTTTSPSPKSFCSHESIHEDIMQIEKCLEKIGVVSEEVKRFIKNLRERRIPAKICGAGGNAKGSGVVFAFAEDKKILGDICRAYNFQILDIKLMI